MPLGSVTDKTPHPSSSTCPTPSAHTTPHGKPRVRPMTLRKGANDKMALLMLAGSSRCVSSSTRRDKIGSQQRGERRSLQRSLGCLVSDHCIRNSAASARRGGQIMTCSQQPQTQSNQPQPRSYHTVSSISEPEWR